MTDFLYIGRSSALKANTFLCVHGVTSMCDLENEFDGSGGALSSRSVGPYGGVLRPRFSKNIFNCQYFLFLERNVGAVSTQCMPAVCRNIPSPQAAAAPNTQQCWV